MPASESQGREGQGKARQRQGKAKGGGKQTSQAHASSSDEEALSGVQGVGQCDTAGAPKHHASLLFQPCNLRGYWSASGIPTDGDVLMVRGRLDCVSVGATGTDDPGCVPQRTVRIQAKSPRLHAMIPGEICHCTLYIGHSSQAESTYVRIPT
ncbi:hypothetical protein LY78DRAFT_654796, partial [Colletotrichum sublineola]